MDDRKKLKATEVDTHDALVQAAKTLFAQKGFDGTTVKDLSELAGVNVSLVSYHFGGKDGLYRACLEEFGQNRLAAAQRMLQPPSSLEEFRIRLTMYIEEMFTFQSEQKEVTQIIMREFEVEMSHAWDVFQNTFIKVFDTLVEFFREAQARGILRADLDARLMATIFFGSFMHLSRSDRLTKRFQGVSLADPAYREKVINHMITMCLEGCTP
ncbi:MAG: TetR/AcrR family transcriptional regulator [Bdellovibrionota bacterium]